MNKLIKIAFIVPSLRNLGPVIVVHNIISLLSKRDNVYIKVFYFDFFDNDILTFEVECEQISFYKRYDFSSFDIVHTHGIRPDIYTFFNQSGKCNISTQHNIIFDEYIINNSYFKSKFVEKLWIFSLKNKDKVVAIGNTAKKYYQKFFLNDDKVINIPNGRTLNFENNIPINDLNLIENFKKNYLCIGTCTRVIKRKGHKQILQALVQLKQACFILVGDGDYLDELKTFANDIKVSDRCLFLGYRANATDYLTQFDIFSQTSYAESISIALLEAAAAQKAIVCSDISVNRDVFSDAEVSFFTLDDVSNLVLAIQKLALNLLPYQKNVFSKYRNEYTSEIMAEKYYNLYKSLVNEV
ncbi:glycosyltransferase family 4 protein [Acinetobacter ursingii]